MYLKIGGTEEHNVLLFEVQASRKSSKRMRNKLLEKGEDYAYSY